MGEEWGGDGRNRAPLLNQKKNAVCTIASLAHSKGTRGRQTSRHSPPAAGSHTHLPPASNDAGTTASEFGSSSSSRGMFQQQQQHVATTAPAAVSTLSSSSTTQLSFQHGLACEFLVSTLPSATAAAAAGAASARTTRRGAAAACTPGVKAAAAVAADSGWQRQRSSPVPGRIVARHDPCCLAAAETGTVLVVAPAKPSLKGEIVRAQFRAAAVFSMHLCVLWKHVGGPPTAHLAARCPGRPSGRPGGARPRCHRCCHSDVLPLPSDQNASDQRARARDGRVRAPSFGAFLRHVSRRCSPSIARSTVAGIQ